VGTALSRSAQPPAFSATVCRTLWKWQAIVGLHEASATESPPRLLPYPYYVSNLRYCWCRHRRLQTSGNQLEAHGRWATWQLPGPRALGARLCDGGVGFGLWKLQLQTRDWKVRLIAHAGDEERGAWETVPAFAFCPD
jgi:hypothetical protein